MKYSIHFIALQTALQMKEQLAAGVLEADTPKYFFPGELSQIDIVRLPCVQKAVMHLVVFRYSVTSRRPSLAVITPLSYILWCRHTWTILQCKVFHRHESHCPVRCWCGGIDQACKQRLLWNL